MGERNKTCSAIILNVKNSGENNRTATVLSPQHGIIYLTLYGGPKSKLKSYVQSFNSGILYFYDDEQKNSKKISDFDVKNSHISFRTSLYKLCAANLASEIIIKTKCAGDSKSAFFLLNGFLDGLDLCEENECKLGTVRFLWRYINLLGVNPDIHTCNACASSLLESKNNFYYEKENGFLCSDCISSISESDLKSAGNFLLSQNSLTYLAAVSELKPKDVRKIPVDEEIYTQTKNLCFYLIEKACGRKLNSIESGIGIL